jgi:hypothetical protein
VAFLSVHVRQQGKTAVVPEVPDGVVQGYVISRQSSSFQLKPPAPEHYFRSFQM